jgi:hypothetical protein
MATQTELEALAMVSKVRFSFAGTLTPEEAGDIIIRLAHDIQRERRQEQTRT